MRQPPMFAPGAFARRWLLLWCACWIAACGGAQPHVDPLQSADARVEPTGLRVLSLVRATTGVVRLSLWIDAGSRDAEPAQLATLAAWSAASLAGPDASVRVFPDATEIAIECGTEQAEDAVGRLAKALGARSISPAVLSDGSQRLRAARAAHEADSDRKAQELALRALFGDAAGSLWWLGDAARDRELEASDVAAFLAHHYGPARALLIAAGDVSATSLSRAIGAHYTQLPDASEARQERALPAAVEPTNQVRAAAAEQAWVGIAVRATDQAAASSLAQRLAQRWTTRPSHVGTLTVRGGAIAFASAAADDAVGPLLSAFEVVTQPNAAPVAIRQSDDLTAISERAGLRFATQSSAIATPLPAAAGLSVIVPRAVRGSPTDEARIEGVAEAQRERVRRAIAHASRTPQLRGDKTDASARVVLPNGARIAVQRRAGDNVGIAIRFLGGAEEEHVSGHGRSALLALLSAQACDGLGPGALATRLRGLGAELSPTLDPDSFGLRMVLPRAQWSAGVELTLRCALQPLLNRRVLRDAQAHMLGAWAQSAPHGRAARVAHTLAPQHPGTIAPWGDADSALLDLDTLVRAQRQRAVGARLAVSVVGDVPVDAVVTQLARRLGDLPAGTLPASRTVEPPPPSLQALERSDTEHSQAIVAFRADLDAPDTIGARVFAALLGERLARQPATTVRWLDAGSYAAGAWAAVEVTLPTESLEGLDTTVDRLRAEIAAAPADGQRQALLTRAAHQVARSMSEPQREADATARQWLAGTRRSDPQATISALCSVKAHYWIGRAPREGAPASQP